mgnify:FL=1
MVAQDYDNITSSKQLCMLLDHTFILEGIGGRVDIRSHQGTFVESRFRIYVPSAQREEGIRHFIFFMQA